MKRAERSRLKTCLKAVLIASAREKRLRKAPEKATNRNDERSRVY